ncbi:type II secretion system protein [Leuconostoc citreum]|uniref:type II secretion system protein n=1 Tax=Leuconostoc citreum TaxID=33964 RepID=UPI001FAC1DFB|nr:type II secretion system protein [Leuconostoc citreum]
MKHIDKGYTLIESLIVLGIIAGVITFGVQNSLPQTSNINHKHQILTIGKRLFTRIGNMFVLLRNKSSKNAMFVLKKNLLQWLMLI